MFREISQSEFEPFFGLMAEIECGSHYNRQDPVHVAYVQERISRRYGSGARFYGMFDGNGAPLGIAGLLIDLPLHSDGWGRAELVDIGVFPQYRSQGFGSELLTFVENEARMARAYGLYLVTYALARKTIEFYLKNGYAPVAGIPGTNGPADEGDVWLRKILVEIPQQTT